MPSEPITVKDEIPKIHKPKAILYAVLFAIAILIVFDIIPALIGTIIIISVLFVVDRKALVIVDYPLLLTFVFFFIFAGNLARIDTINEFLSKLMNMNTLVVSAISCQFISNVPSAILLSQFTSNYQDLLVGVNIGGAGTLIASLASLITFREYTKHNPGKTGHYIKIFSIFNFSFLGILLLLNIFI
jgi:cation transport ATPase